MNLNQVFKFHLSYLVIKQLLKNEHQFTHFIKNIYTGMEAMILK